MSATVRDMIKTRLAETGFQGLYCRDCGCGIDALAPCDEIGMGCKAAKKSTCKRCGEVWYGPDVGDMCGECDDSWGGTDDVEKHIGRG
jgi:hypothetical protein